MQTYVRIIILCAALAALFPLAHVVLFGYGVEYSVPFDPAAYQAMTFEEQQAWDKQHQIRLTGFQVLGHRVSDGRFWVSEYLPFASSTFVLLLIACFSTLKLHNRAVSPNQPLHPTPSAGEAPASGAGERRRYKATAVSVSGSEHQPPRE